MANRISFLRPFLLSGTTLFGAVALCVNTPAWAACSPSVPTAGQTVTCTGVDTVGISGGADNVTVSMTGTSSISTTGVSAVDLGSGTTFSAGGGTSFTSDVDAIRTGTGSWFSFSNITSTNGTGIVYTGGGGGYSLDGVFSVTGGGGTALDFSAAPSFTLALIEGTTITGNVLAGSGTLDSLRLKGTSTTASFDATEIGTKYTGFDTFSKLDTGTWTLTGTGNQAWTVQGGKLVGDTTSMSGNLAVSSGANATFDQNTDGTYSSVISGAGSVTKTGSGVVTLSGANTYTGGTTINNGTLTLSADNNLGGAGNVTFTGGSGKIIYEAGFSSARNVVLTANGSFNTNGFNSTLSGVISGGGGLQKTGAGTLTLSGTNTYTGTTNLYSGILSVSADANLGATSSVLNFDGGTLQQTGSLTTSRNITLGAGGGTLDNQIYGTTLSGVISGTGSFTKTGSGTLSLTGANTYSGGTTVSNGSLRGNSGSLQGSIVNNANVTFNQTVNGSYNSVMSGTGTLTKLGTGTLTLGGTNTYSGGTTVSGGVLNVSANANLGNTSGAITLNGGTLQYGTGFTSARAVTLGASNGTIDQSSGTNAALTGVISGTGSLTKIGSGLLSLTGTNTYTGGTTLSTGDLRVTTSSLPGDIVDNARLFFSQTTTGTYAGVISGTGGVWKQSSGTVTFSGANTYTGGTTFEGGILNVSADNNLGATSGALNFNGGTLQYGTGFNTARNITLAAGNGTFDTNGFNSTLSGVISGAGGLIKTGSSSLILTGTNTYTGGTTVSGGRLNVTTTSLPGDVTNNNFLRFAQGGNGTYGGVISGTGLLEKTGTGIVTLTGTNTYTGGTSIMGGAFNVTSDSNLGGAGALTLDTGTLQYGAAFDTARNITLGAGGGSISNAGFNTTLSGVISGAGTLYISNSGAVTTLSGTNTYTGATTISNGTVQISSDSNLGSGGSLTLNQGANLRTTADMTVARDVVLTGNQGLVDTNGHDVELSGVVSGTGAFRKTGAGTLTLTGNNTFSNVMRIDSGTLNVSADNNLGGAAATMIINSGTLQYGAAFDSARNISLGTSTSTVDTNGFNSKLSGIISNIGKLIKTGLGKLTLTGVNTYTGGSTISAGTLEGDTDSLQGDILNNAALQFDQGSTGTYGDVVSGTGSLTKIGAGNLILTGANTYSGGTTVSAGRLSVNGSITGLTTIDSGGELGGNGTTGDIINNGTLSPGNSIGTLNVTGDVTFNSGSTYKVEVNDAGSSDKIIASGNLILNGGTVDVRAASGSYGAMTTYTIAQGASRTGTFAGVTTDLAFLDPTLAYTADSVMLDLTRNDAAFNIVAQDKVQQGVANAVEDLGGGNDLYDAFVGLNEAQAGKALDTLSGEHNVGLTTANTASTAAIRNVVTNHIQTVLSSAMSRFSSAFSAAPDVSNPATLEPAAGGDGSDGRWLDGRSHVWTDVFGTDGHTGSKGTAPSQNTQSGGALFGADRLLTDDLYGGVLFGYERGEVYTDSQKANSDINSYHLGAYGAWDSGTPFRLSAGITASYHQIDTTRDIAFGGFSDIAKGETDGFTTSGFMEGTYRIDIDQGFNIEPYVGIGVTHSYIGDYRETDGGAADLAVDALSQTIPFHTLGLRSAYEFKGPFDSAMRVTGRIGWEHDYGDLKTSSDMRFLAGATKFTVDGPESARDSATVGAGLELALPHDTFAYTTYDGSYSDNSVNQGVTLGMKVKF